MGKGSSKKHRPEPERPEPRDPAFGDELLRATAFDRRRDRNRALTVFGIAFVLRLIYFVMNESRNPCFHFPAIDALYHHDWAQAILAGDFWGTEVFFRAPLYPYLLALIYKLTGTSIGLAVLFQHLLGSASCVLAYLLGRRYFAEGVALLAGILCALYWPLIYFEGELLVVTLAVFLDLLLLLTLARAVERGGDRPFLLAGLVMGLSALARPSILVLAPVLPLVFRAAEGEGKAPPRSWRRRSILVGLALLVTITPALVRNWAVGRDFVPIASSGGVNFYIGNNPSSNGSNASLPGVRADMQGSWQGAVQLAEQEAGRRLKPSEASRHYFAKGLRFWVDHPGKAAALTLEKLRLFWAGPERSNNKYIGFFWRRFGLGRLPLPGFWLAGSLGLLGAVLLWRRRRRFSLLYLYLASYMLGVVAFFVVGRFRLPVLPVLILFSSYALFRLAGFFRGKRRGLPVVLVALALSLVLVNHDYLKGRAEPKTYEETLAWFTLGDAYFRAREADEAIAALEEARAIQQRHPDQRYLQFAGEVDIYLGILYKAKGLYPQAAQAFERIRSGDPNALYARRELAQVYEQMHRLDAAKRAYRSVLEDSPRDAASLLGLARISKRLGDAEGMREAMQSLGRFYPGDPRIEAELAKIKSMP